MVRQAQLAFSTLGCPGDPIERVLAIARASGARGLELRCFPGEPVAPGAPDHTLRRVRDEAAANEVSVVCLASYVEVGAVDDPVAQLLWHVAAARELGAPFVRVFGAADGDPGTLERSISVLRFAARQIQGSGVAVLLETHDSFPTGAAVAEVLREVDSPDVGVIWDVVNPWRHGESPGTTVENLRPWLRHVQLKDIATAGDLKPVLPGDGSVPLGPILHLLDDIGYDGWLSLEWEKAWHPTIPPLEVALARLSHVLERAR